MADIRPSVDDTLEYYKPTEYPPPLGEKIYLYTVGGVGTIGTWGEGCLGWRPMFRASEEMKSQVIGN